MASNFAAVQQWAKTWREQDGDLLRLDYRPVGGRLVGVNELPYRVWIEEWDHLWSLLRIGPAVRRFTDLLELTRSTAPGLTDWMLERPHDVLSLADQWQQLVATVLWIDSRAAPHHYLRQIDVPGVGTKFIERHQRTLARLLDRQLSPDRIDTAYPMADFAGRYKFRRKPQYVRYRWLEPDRRTAGFTELSVRVDELAVAAPDAETVVIIENETTYLALPSIPKAIAIFGGGYALTRLDVLAWPVERRVHYWGDIDTHGFAILARLRERFPHVRSLLMDRATLLAHESQWVREPSPITAPLELLTAEETDLYRDLVEDALGDAVRLEQERIRFGAVEAALRTI